MTASDCAGFKFVMRAFFFGCCLVAYFTIQQVSAERLPVLSVVSESAGLRDRTLEQVKEQLELADLRFLRLEPSESIWQVVEYRRLQFLRSLLHEQHLSRVLPAQGIKKKKQVTETSHLLSWSDYLYRFQLDARWLAFDRVLPRAVARQSIDRLSVRSELTVYPSAGENGNLSGEEFPRRTFAFTFDDGPDFGETTEAIISIMKENGQKTTFFQVVSSSVALPDKVSAELSEGHLVACHSWSHANLMEAGADLELEITQAKNKLEEIIQARVGLFRLPYGEGDEDPVIRDRIADNRMVHIYWNIDSLDWADPDPQSVATRVLELAKSQNRGIVLFHDIKKHTPAVIRMVLPYFKHRLRHLCRLDYVIDYLNGAKFCWRR